MKKYLIILCLLGVCKIGIAQTNIFPDTGRVGIGTVNPIVKLQVRTAPNSNIGLFDYSGSPTLVGFTDEGASTTLRLAGYPLTFSGNGGMGNEHLRIHTNGNVGIGTTNPDSKLTVAGNIHSREVKVTINAGADFVFEDSYQLEKLEKLEKFIQENKHLPEIASAEEMKKNGLELGEMNIKLLQKIEELTLHLIEMNKKLEAQGVRIDQLSNMKL